MIAGALRREDESMDATERIPELQVDDRIRVSIQKTGELDPTVYLSRVAEAATGDYRIEWPTRGGSKPPVRDRDVLFITFNARGLVYCFEACVMAIKQDQIPLLEIRRLGPIRRTQRREYVRVSTAIKV